jgi:hypothetical protein
LIGGRCFGSFEREREREGVAASALRPRVSALPASTSTRDETAPLHKTLRPHQLALIPAKTSARHRPRTMDAYVRSQKTAPAPPKPAKLKEAKGESGESHPTARTPETARAPPAGGLPALSITKYTQSALEYG